MYDVTMFAADHGFPWSDVVRSAVIAKGIFPKLEGESDLEVTIKDLKSGADGSRCSYLIRISCTVSVKISSF